MRRIRIAALAAATSLIGAIGAPATAQVIQRIGDMCPYDYYASGDFCKASSKKARHAIPNPGGGQCPFGYHGSGINYCLKNMY